MPDAPEWHSSLPEDIARSLDDSMHLKKLPDLLTMYNKIPPNQRGPLLKFLDSSFTTLAAETSESPAILIAPEYELHIATEGFEGFCLALFVVAPLKNFTYVITEGEYVKYSIIGMPYRAWSFHIKPALEASD